MEDGWWYAQGEDRRGPLSTMQVRELFQAGTLGPRTLVWRPGRLAWKPLLEVAELAEDRQEPVLLPPPAVGGETREPGFELVELAKTPPSPEFVPDWPSWARPDHQALGAPRHVLRLPLAGPWRRFFAQLFDIWTLCVPVGFLLGNVLGRTWPAFALWMSSPGSEAGLGFILVPLALVVQAVIFGLFGTTPGKLILGVEVTLLGGGRPTFMAYLGRLTRLYASGLALGIPLISLFTMWRQYGLVKAGRPASYDAARFQVHAVPMGALRRSVAAAAMIGLFGGFGYLQHLDREAKNSYFAGFDWRNPISDRSVSIPRGWVYTEQVNETGDPIFTFSSHASGVIAFFAMEEGLDSISLDQYQRMWVAAVRPQMAMDARGTPMNVKGRFGLQMRGVMVGNASRRIHTTLVKNGDQAWRVVIVGTSGREPDTSETERLRNALFETLPDRPERPAGPARPSRREESI
ncbi:RDD family protein [Variovorax sp. M-6]|uniref:RDD family protein n=1 Tax=Variovorax sp. M-6 TaxID=3233041 RepID=UPI003F9E1F6B